MKDLVSGKWRANVIYPLIICKQDQHFNNGATFNKFVYIYTNYN